MSTLILNDSGNWDKTFVKWTLRQPGEAESIYEDLNANLWHARVIGLPEVVLSFISQPESLTCNAVPIPPDEAIQIIHATEQQFKAHNSSSSTSGEITSNETFDLSLKLELIELKVIGPTQITFSIDPPIKQGETHNYDIKLQEFDAPPKNIFAQVQYNTDEGAIEISLSASDGSLLDNNLDMEADDDRADEGLLSGHTKSHGITIMVSGQQENRYELSGVIHRSFDDDPPNS